MLELVLTSDKRNTICLSKKKQNMNQFSKQNDNKKTASILVMFVLFLLSNVSVFGQTVAEKDTDSNTTIENNLVEKEATSNTSNMNFVIWFMGSKQNPNNTTTIKAGENTRKQFMTSGLAPNRLLIKAFLKKAVNFEVATA
jgi:hypothetical protein